MNCVVNCVVKLYLMIIIILSASSICHAETLKFTNDDLKKYDSKPMPITERADQSNNSQPKDRAKTHETSRVNSDFSSIIYDAPPSRVPQTGQTTCYDSSGKIISCAGTGQDGAIRAGVPWPIPRFKDNGNQTITDSLTGLVWPKNGSTQTVGLCTGGAMTWQEALNYVACLNSSNYLNDTHWRLPNVNELKSLNNKEKVSGATWLNNVGFDKMDGRDFYWSSNSVKHDSDKAYGVTQEHGEVNPHDSKTAKKKVLPVTSGRCRLSEVATCLPKTGQMTSYAMGDDGNLQSGVTWPNPRFELISAYSGTVVLDKLTGLLWTQDGNTPGPTNCKPGVNKTWQEAFDYVDCLNMRKYLGYSDWRVPNVNELSSLLNVELEQPATWLNAQGFNVEPASYWSSTTFVANNFQAWLVRMENYWPGVGWVTKLGHFCVWPVR